MPTISIFFGIIIQMHWRDHAPPHYHALYQGFEALIAIESGDIIAGDLPTKAKRILREWTEEHRDALMANWSRGENHEPFELIPGADV
jgi:hypothetical protein